MNRYHRGAPHPFAYSAYYIFNAIFFSPFPLSLPWLGPYHFCHKCPSIQINKTDGRSSRNISIAYRTGLDSVTKTFHSCLLFQISPLVPAVNPTFNPTGLLIAPQIHLDSFNLPNFFLPQVSRPLLSHHH